MKRRLSLFLLLAGSLGSAANLILGWNMSHTEQMEPETHLILAISSLIASCGGALMLILTFESGLRQSEREALMKNQKPSTEALRNQLASAARASYALFAVYPLSIITGTIAHPGKLPLLHAVLGVVVLATSIACLFTWLKVFRVSTP